VQRDGGGWGAIEIDGRCGPVETGKVRLDEAIHHIVVQVCAAQKEEIDANGPDGACLTGVRRSGNNRVDQEGMLEPQLLYGWSLYFQHPRSSASGHDRRVTGRHNRHERGVKFPVCKARGRFRIGQRLTANVTQTQT
jgi:hypothetical protein